MKLPKVQEKTATVLTVIIFLVVGNAITLVLVNSFVYVIDLIMKGFK